MTACAALPERPIRKEFCQHTMSARSRTAAGSRERGWSRAVPEVFYESPPQQPPAQSHSVRRPAELLECLNGFSFHELCVTGCHVFHRIFCWTFFLPQADPGKPRATIARQALVSRKTHEFVGLSQDTRVFSFTHNKSIFAPRRRTAEQLHGPLGIFQDTRILTCQRPPYLYAFFL